ncbi:MAG: forespore capture DNA-binding protein RefZ [Bacillus sp. (in: firmicutes)]
MMNQWEIKKNTKQAIVEAALQLFHTKGFDGTSIRDIAQKAKTNSANIAYYFKNKHGLLEYCFVRYLEDYITIIELEVAKLEETTADQCLLSVVSKLIAYQRKNHLAARFVIREMTLDTNLNREIIATYMAKENYNFQCIINYGIKKKVFRKVCPSTFILQLKGLLSAPVMHAHYAQELLQFYPQEKYYMNKYRYQCELFITQYLLKQKEEVVT